MEEEEQEQEGKEISRGDLVFRKTEECVSEVKQKEDDEEEEEEEVVMADDSLTAEACYKNAGRTKWAKGNSWYLNAWHIDRSSLLSSLSLSLLPLRGARVNAAIVFASKSTLITVSLCVIW